MVRKQATMQEWEEMGEAAKQLRNQIEEFTNLMTGKTKASTLKKAMNLMMRLSRLRSDLENEMFQQHPDKASIEVFYGKESLPVEFASSSKNRTHT